MSRFFSSKYATLTPYTPGEQPRERQYIKLNTNESPFPPHPEVAAAAADAAKRLQLYSDPTCRTLCECFSKAVGVAPDEVIPGNGSDEVLNFAFMAFCDEETPAVYPDITYGFYPVFARINTLPSVVLPLREDLSVDVDAILGTPGTLFLANPNAPTGICLSRCEIERILSANPERIVVVDEAYVDFGAESCVPLIHKYDNLLVTQTFSKSRSLAGGRLGFAIGNRELIRDLNTVKYSLNPYNINSMTMAAGIATLAHPEYTAANCQTVIQTREKTAKALRALGFALTDSRANFLFAAHPALPGDRLYRALRERGILVRRFDTDRIRDYNRITVGSPEEMQALLRAVEEILEETK